jgi:glucose/arabinose dehydrogenase
VSSVCRDESQVQGLSSELSARLKQESGATDLERPRIERPAPKYLASESNSKAPLGGDSHYRIEHFPLPKEANLMVTGMDFLANGHLIVCTWPGEVWVVENVTGLVELARYRCFARGLNEPLGLKVVKGSVYIVQKCELTRLSDVDGDGEADLYENINDSWGYTGSYHAFAFGPATDSTGNFFVALCAQRGRWDVPYLGWTVKISPDGRKAEGFCSGLRAPNGIASFGPEPDIFVTDNEAIGSGPAN